MTVNTIPKYENLVFEGGGAKGIAFCGAIRALDDAGIMKNIKRIAGSSAGAIVSAALAIGYKYDEIQKILLEADFSKFKDSNYGPLGYVYRILNYYGVYLGDYFHNWIGDLVKVKTGSTDTTLKEVYEKFGIELVITGTCINKGKVVYFNHNDNPDMMLRTAVRISAGMPYIFEVMKYKGDMYVDGGVLDNYPIWYFDNDPTKTLGLKLVNPTERRDNQIYYNNGQIHNIKDYTYNLINAMLDQIDRLHIRDQYWQHTITIDTLGVFSTDFSLSREKREELIKSGYVCGKKFIDQSSL